MSLCDVCGETCDLLSPITIVVDGEVRHLLACAECESEAGPQ